MPRAPRVLVVEDDPSIRLLLGIELPDCGFDPLIVAGAGAALQVLEA
jgi:CheY-like chemotaxis protein